MLSCAAVMLALPLSARLQGHSHKDLSGGQPMCCASWAMTIKLPYPGSSSQLMLSGLSHGAGHHGHGSERGGAVLRDWSIVGMKGDAGTGQEWRRTEGLVHCRDER